MKYNVYILYLARGEQLMRINGPMFQMSQTNPGLPVPNDHRYTQNIQDIIRHINNTKQTYNVKLFVQAKNICKCIDNTSLIFL